jgi:hypothetical protein
VARAGRHELTSTILSTAQVTRVDSSQPSSTRSCPRHRPHVLMDCADSCLRAEQTIGQEVACRRTTPTLDQTSRFTSGSGAAGDQHVEAAGHRRVEEPRDGGSEGAERDQVVELGRPHDELADVDRPLLKAHLACPGSTCAHGPGRDQDVPRGRVRPEPATHRSRRSSDRVRRGWSGYADLRATATGALIIWNCGGSGSAPRRPSARAADVATLLR